MMKKCVIIGAGECNIALLRKRHELKEGDFCIAADGGLKYLIAIGKTPDLLIGDMDSLGMVEPNGQFKVRRLPVEKDDTDLLAAIKEGLELGFRKFELYGGLGGRLDHTIANIQCLLYLLNRGANGILVGDDMTLRVIRNEAISLPADHYEAGRKISVFAFGGDAYGVTEKGLKYSVDNVTIRQEFPIGVSNEFIGEDAEISVENGMLLICIQTDELEGFE